MSWTYRLNQFLWGSLDWIFPPVCGGCNRLGFRWCPDCQRQGQLIPEPICQKCGLPIHSPGLCPACLSNPPAFEALRSWMVFEGPIRLALHKLKYRRNLGLGDALAHQMQEFIHHLDWRVDIVVPVPLGKTRLQERGYNQVALVARPLAELNHWQYCPGTLSRARETRSQVGLNALERKENVSGAFTADPGSIRGGVVLVMDDVVTTGATLSACAQACLQAEARQVFALTLARALPHHGYQVV